MLYLSDFKTSYHNKNTFKAGENASTSKQYKNGERSWKEWFLVKYFSESLDEYCKSGSLHGLRYIRDPSIPRTERMLWLAVLLFFLHVSTVVIWDAYLSGVTHKCELVVNPRSTPIWEIPFPTVRICSMYPIRKSVFDLNKEVDNKKFRHFSKLVCHAKTGFGHEVFNDTIDEEFFDFIAKAAIPCRELIVNCYWRNRKRDCCTLFKPYITHLGVCFVFNSIPGEVLIRDYTPPPGAVSYNGGLEFWKIDTGYPNRDGVRGKKVRPYWAEYSGPLSGITFDLVDIKEEYQEICSFGQSGFEVYVYAPHTNNEIGPGIKVPYNMHSHITLDPNFIHAEENLRSIPSDERECAFEDEISLDYFNDYSQASCKMECFIKAVMHFCGCKPFFSRRFIRFWNYPYCNDAMFDCKKKVIGNFIGAPLQREKGPLKSCMCIPACNDLVYALQTTFQQVVTPDTLPPWAPGYNESSEENIARVSVYFSLQQFNSKDLKRTSSITDFLGNCGGLLGLLLGFSFMSLFEVVYFAVIRPLNKIIIFYIKHGFK